MGSANMSITGEGVGSALLSIYFHCERSTLSDRADCDEALDRCGIRPLPGAIDDFVALNAPVPLRQFVVAVLIRAGDAAKVQPSYIVRLAEGLPDPRCRGGSGAPPPSLLADLLALLEARGLSREQAFNLALQRMTGRALEGYHLAPTYADLVEKEDDGEGLVALADARRA